MTKLQTLFLAALLAGALSPAAASAQGISLGASASGSTSTGETSASAQAETTPPAAATPEVAAPAAAAPEAPAAPSAEVTTTAAAPEAPAAEAPAVEAPAAEVPAAEATVTSDAAVAADVPSDDPDKFGSPWGVEANTWELGLYWGLFFADSKHELYDAGDLSISHKKLETVTPQLGLRAGYFPLRLLGVEVEGGLMPSQVRSTGDGVNLFAIRAHAVLLAPTKTIVPFVVAGGGVLGVSSDAAVLGSDLDGSFHVGIGAKAFVSRDIAVRLDVRDNFSSGLGDNEIAQHIEALVGISVVNGRSEPPPPPADTDGDGVSDDADKCPSDAGPAPDGCPPPPDTDGDGISDDLDKCPGEAGVASNDDKHGCPPPPPDGDGDGVPDASDKCPDVKGDNAEGCLADDDGDGLPNRDDKCASEPETKNGYEDQDGCPDELPEQVKKYTGAIPGISFDANKATIRPTSFKALDEAAKVLVEYPALRMEISGHTDNSGKPEKNQELSAARAEAVKTYLVEKGVAADRIVTRGAGPSEPVADNATKEGRAQNRRIEFKLLQQ